MPLFPVTNVGSRVQNDVIATTGKPQDGSNFHSLILCLGRAVKHANLFEVVLFRKQDLYYDIISTYALKIGSLNSSGKLNELPKL